MSSSLRSLVTRDIEVLRRSSQPHYDRVMNQIVSYERRGERVLWISDRETNMRERSLNERSPDILLNVVCLTHLGVALLITELIAHEIAHLIVLEGAPLSFEQHHLRLRWICARFNVKLIVLGD